MTHLWSEDEMTPAVDVLTADFTANDSILPVAHPEWFQPGDVVRVGDEDLYDTGEVDAAGRPILRARNEAVLVNTRAMAVTREYGSTEAQSKPRGERVTILGSISVAWMPPRKPAISRRWTFGPLDVLVSSLVGRLRSDGGAALRVTLSKSAPLAPSSPFSCRVESLRVS